MIPDDVEKIIMTKEDYDRNVEQLLYDKINAEQEIERLNKAREIDIEYNKYLQKEIIRLNNIINELEKYINEEYIYDELGMKIFDASKLQDKLQELKGSGSNE